jgi:hypothetical protein
MVAHPAKFSDSILDVIYDLVPDKNAFIIDPFAGTGKIHNLGLNTVGIEIEPEWAHMHPRTMVGNTLNLIFPDNTFDGGITSVCYANRMSDSHNAREICKACNGEGGQYIRYGPDDNWDSETCEKCNGKGFRNYDRITYTHKLGRKLHPDNAGQFQWGPKYIYFTVDTYIEILRVIKNWFILNISDHIRNGKIIEVSQFHFDVLDSLGMRMVKLIEVETPRMRKGANSLLRVDHENVALFRKDI